MSDIPNVILRINYVNPENKYNENNEREQNYIEQRHFYGCINNYNYVTYVDKGSKDTIDYVDYSGNREKSSGVFNENGLLDNVELRDLKKRLQNTQSVIWHGVISFEEEFGNQRYQTYEQAFNLMKNKMPRLFSMMGLKPNNIEWYAGLHENTDNRHIHFAFYEKKPLRIYQGNSEPQYSFGKIKEDVMDKFKIEVELGSDDYWFTNITTKRKITMEKLSKALNGISVNDNGELIKKMRELYNMRPKTGMLSYDSENMAPLKDRIDSITKIIITKNKAVYQAYMDYVQKILEKDREIRVICERNKIDSKKFLLTNKYLNDIYRRMGNKVISCMFELERKFRDMNFESKSRLVRKRLEKQKRRMLERECLYLSREVVEEALRTFQEHMDKLDEMNFKRLVEEGIIEL